MKIWHLQCSDCKQTTNMWAEDREEALRRFEKAGWQEGPKCPDCAEEKT